MYTVEGEGAIIFGGMYARVVKELKRLGVQYTVEDYRRALPEPLIDQIQGPLREKQDLVLAAIASNHNGVINACTAFGKTYLICQLTRMYPKEKILIVSPRRAVISDIFQRVREVNDGVVTMCDGSRTFREDSNVIVCTTGSLHKIDKEWPTMVFFDECHGAATDRIKELLIELDGPLMFGFSASPTGRGDGADLEVTGLFGEIICTISYQEAQAAGSVAPIEVRMVQFQCDEIQAVADTAKERRGYWRNKKRNKAVAKAALSFKDDEQVLILVKTAEHAMFLHKLLPDFAVVHAGISFAKWESFVKLGLCTGEDYDTIAKVDTVDMKDKFKVGEVLKVIVTTTWKEGVDFPLLKGLVRADGMSGSIPAIQIGGRLSRGSEQKVLYDLTDEMGASYERRSKDRVRNYKKSGWAVKPWIFPEDEK